VATDVTLAPTHDRVHACTLSTPPKSSFIRAHPDRSFRINVYVLVHEVGGKRQTYLLDPSLLTDPDLEGLTKIIALVPWLTHHKPPKLGLWAVSVEHENNPWIRSALNIIEAARNSWLKIIPSGGEYITRDPAVTFAEPDWSKTPATIYGWLDLAFRIRTGSPPRTGSSTPFASPSAKGRDHVG
jgi:hypothetical protein